VYNSGMKRAAVVVVSLLLTLGVAVAVAGGFVGPERVYSLAEVQQGRQSNPAAWAGHTVLVRGQFVGVSTGDQSFEWISPPLTWRRLFSFGSLPRRNNVYRPMLPLVRPLIVVRAPGVTGRTPVTASTLVVAGLELASRLPIVGGLVPDSLAARGITYRVRLLPPRRCAAWSVTPCPDAVLLQVAP